MNTNGPWLHLLLHPPQVIPTSPWSPASTCLELVQLVHLISQYQTPFDGDNLHGWFKRPVMFSFCMHVAWTLACQLVHIIYVYVSNLFVSCNVDEFVSEIWWWHLADGGVDCSPCAYERALDALSSLAKRPLTRVDESNNGGGYDVMFE